MAKIVIQKQSAPATPDAGNAAIFVDSADNKIKIKGEDGMVNTIITDNTLPSTLLDTTKYVSGEAIPKGDIFFTESELPYSSFTGYTFVGDATQNSAVSVRKIGSGVSGTTVNLALLKIGTPTQSLWIRIESDINGYPSGILINNSLASISQGSLTTSLQNISITFTSLSIAKGTPFHVVVIQSTDGSYANKVVNGSAYYGIGTKAEVSNTMYGMINDGSSWVNTTRHSTTKSDSLAGGNSTDARGDTGLHTITPLYDMVLDGVSYGSTISGGSIPLGTAIGGNILQKGVIYTIPFTYSTYSSGSPGSSVTTNYTITAGSRGTQNGGFNISSRLVYMISKGKIFISTPLAESKVIAKASALYNYTYESLNKISINDYPVGAQVMYEFIGISKSRTGLTAGSSYYLSNTFGEISTSAGQYSNKIGVALETDSLYINPIFL